MITHVEPGSLAAQVGLQPKDVLVAVNGQPIRNLQDLKAAMGDQDSISRGIRIQVKRDGMRRFVFLRNAR